MGTTLEIERVLAGENPAGFKTTLVETDRLRELNNADMTKLETVVDDWGGNTLTETDIIRSEIQTVMTSFQVPGADGATLELPATALEFDRVLQFAALYKTDNDTPSGTVKGVQRAGPDDIVFTFAGPEVYEEVSGQSQDTFFVDGITQGQQIELVGDNGLNEATPTAGTSLALDSDERMYFTGDYIDLSGGRGALSKIQWNDIDGENYGPVDGVLQNRLSSTKVFTAQGAHVKSTADLDAKGYTDGRAEIIPVAFYMGPGNKAPSLV